MARCQRVVIGVLVMVIWIGGQAFSAPVDRMIVTFKPGVSLSLQQTIVRLSGSQVVHVLGLIDGLAIKLPLNGLDKVVAFLLNHTLVTGVFDDVLTVVDRVSPLPSDQAPQEEVYPWGLERTGVKAVHETWPRYNGQSVKIAILDTGVDAGHRELRSAVAGGYNALPGGGSFRDRHGHGTHMAGIIAANLNAQGIVGAAYLAQIYAVKVLDDHGAGRTSNVIKGLEWAANRGMDVVSMSLGFEVENPPLQQATRHLYEQGVIMVAAVGNRCSKNPGQEEGGGNEGEGGAPGCAAADQGVKSPARYAWVIAVGATNEADKVTAYSLTGQEVDVMAPGGDQSGQRILSTYPGNGYGWLTGTSPAAAHVSGIVALLLQYRPLSFERVLSLLTQEAVDLGYPETQQGAGRVDAQSAVEMSNH